MRIMYKLLIVYALIMGGFLFYINSQSQYDKVISQFNQKEIPEAVIGLKDVITDYEVVRIQSAVGSAQAQYKMGKIYNKARYVKKDDEVSFNYFQKSADKEYAPAKKELVNSYSRGIGVKKNMEKALSIANELSQSGNSDIDVAMANNYRTGGGGFEVDYEKAKAWAVKSINKRNVEGYNVLGLIYFAQAIKNNNSNFLKSSFKTIQMGARQGDKNAQFRLGVYYGFAIGTDRSLYSAKHWLKRSEHEDVDTIISEITAYNKHINGLNKILAKRYENNMRLKVIERAKSLIGLNEDIILASNDVKK